MVGPLALPLGTSNVMVTQAGAGRPPGLFPPRNRPSSRSWTLSLAVRASKAGGQDGHPLPPYGDLLQQREYELWQRQNRLYDQLLEQHERDRQHWESERQRWVQQETSLKQEVAELRAQQLYLLQSGGAQPRSPSDVRSAAGSTASSSAGSGGSLYAQAPPPRLPAQPTGQLPQPAAGLTAADQVKAVVEAVKAGTSPFDSGAVASSSPATVEEAAMPRYVAELAAAVAAVDELDVLGDINFGNLANRLLSQGWIQGGIQQQEESAVEVGRQQQRPSMPQQPAAPSAGPAGNGSGPAAAPSPAPSRGVGVVSAGPAAAQQNLQSRPPSQPPAAQQQPQRGQGERPVEQLAGAEPAEPAPAPGPRPTLVSGSDDIYWVNELHRALVGAGYYPGEDDVEDFFFGDSTLSAVMTLQACMGLTETGVVDEATWEALLAAQSSDEEGEGPAEAEKAGEPSTGTPTASSGSSSSPSQKPYQDLFAAALGGKQQQQPPVPGQPRQGSSSRDAWNGRPASPAVHVVQEVVLADIVQSTGAGDVQETVTVHEEVKVVGAGAAGSTARTAWPVLMEGDGGREVHALHVALQQGGCYASDDDMRWWQFGDSTLAAVKTFQACNGLPESGVADPATWRALLGAGASPADLDTLRSEDSADDDLGNTANRVWLMGEQRWEDRGRLKRRQGA